MNTCRTQNYYIKKHILLTQFHANFQLKPSQLHQNHPTATQLETSQFRALHKISSKPYSITEKFNRNIVTILTLTHTVGVGTLNHCACSAPTLFRLLHVQDVGISAGNPKKRPGQSRM